MQRLKDRLDLSVLQSDDPEIRPAYQAADQLPRTPENVNMAVGWCSAQNPAQALMAWYQGQRGSGQENYRARLPRSLGSGVTGSGHLTPREAAMVDRLPEDMDELSAPGWTSEDTATFYGAFRR
jgi:hypothetical protein